ncbi:hypothetical protein MKMG_02193 [Methanogenium sp. MK-MG]|nr:hypothetical protein MKMG_02193 [Methanogenium sp. MK-MG]
MLEDTDPMVQKGYGWLLKVASADHPDEVFAFLKAHADRMPRTTFRYALEKMPEEQRQEAMRW